eukprot:g3607.t2
MILQAALLGAGIFARDAYLPILKAHEDKVKLVAVWSRSVKTVQSTLASSPYKHQNGVDQFTGEDGLNQILAAKHIDIVFNVLPVHVCLEMTQRCLAAGKHVLQEKPIGPSTTLATQAIQEYIKNKKSPIWHFAENYRFERIFSATKNYRSCLGKITKIDYTVNTLMNEKNKYFTSAWRRDANLCPGGFIFEGAVHFVAALRLIAQKLGCGEIEVVSGMTLHQAPEKLPPQDTLTSWLRFEDGTPGTFSLTYAAAQAKICISIVGTEGTMEIRRLAPAGHILTVEKENKVVESYKEESFNGIEDEILQFIYSVNAFSKARNSSLMHQILLFL